MQRRLKLLKSAAGQEISIYLSTSLHGWQRRLPLLKLNKLQLQIFLFFWQAQSTSKSMSKSCQAKNQVQELRKLFKVQSQSQDD